MKKLIFITAIISILLTSCSHDPYADFVANTDIAYVGEEVYFTNRSQDAIDYEWNFGDGYVSYNLNAFHSWLSPGIYQVSLTAFGKDGKMDVTIMDIEVIQGYGNLEITVEEYYDPYYLVENARVRIYPTVYDWENETNLVAQGYTNSSGIVTFIDLIASTRYYIDVYGDYHDNYQLAAEDAVWIETDVIVPDVLNYFTAVVDYYPDGKKSATDTKTLKVIRKTDVEEAGIIRNPEDRVK